MYLVKTSLIDPATVSNSRRPGRGGFFPTLLGLLLCTGAGLGLLPAQSSSREGTPFPQELIGIQTQYFRDLEAVEEKHRKELGAVRVEYYQQLQALGRAYVENRDQVGALAAKVEMQRLETPVADLPAPSTVPPPDLVELREGFEDKSFKIKADLKFALDDLARKYVARLELWATLYRENKKLGEARAVEKEIRGILARLEGKSSIAGPESEDDVVAEVPPTPSTISPTAAPEDPLATVLENVAEPEPAVSPLLPTLRPDGVEPGPGTDLPQPPAGLVLNPGWEGTASANPAMARELSSLLSPYGEPKVDQSTFPGLILYGKVSYLMPLPEARKILELEAIVPETGYLQTSGWPGAQSLKYYRYQGKFDGAYTHLTIITDTADHVVSIQLTSGPSGLNMRYRPLLPEWKFYDLVRGQYKSIEAETVWHKIFSRNLMGEFVEEADNVLNPHTPCLRIDTIYFDVDMKMKFLGRLYLTKPFLNTLLYTCEGG